MCVVYGSHVTVRLCFLDKRDILPLHDTTSLAAALHT